jgi:predicted ATPase
VQVHDRSPLCTLALARYLRHPVPPVLETEIARIIREHVYEPAVFFVRPIGFVEPTMARRISYQDSLAFESLHEAVYRDHGFEIVDVAAARIVDRAAVVANWIASLSQ